MSSPPSPRPPSPPPPALSATAAAPATAPAPAAPSPSDAPLLHAANDNGRQGGSLSVASEMTSKAEEHVSSLTLPPPAPVWTPPLPTPSPSIANAPSPFAFMGADSDASSELSSDDDDDDDDRPTWTRGVLSGEVRPPMTRGLLSAEVRPPVARREDPLNVLLPSQPPPVHVNDFAFQQRANTARLPLTPLTSITPPLDSPVSVDLPPQGDHPREVRWQLPEDHPMALHPGERGARDSGDSDARGQDSDDDGVFAFQRPPTAGQETGQSSGTLSYTVSTDPASSHPSQSYPTAPLLTAPSFSYTTEAPINGYRLEDMREYDASCPPPYSGRDNINNSVFAFGHTHQLRRRGGTARAMSPTVVPVPLDADISLKPHTPTTGTTVSTTELSEYGDVRNVPPAVTGRFHRISRPSTAGRPSTGRPSTMDSNYFSDWAEDDDRYRPQTRQSRAVTELTGDETVPDGMTTWGDGVGGDLNNRHTDPDKPDWYEEDSPYAEVRASVSNIDDPEMPALTLRAWCLGMFLCIVGSSANIFFSFRNPSPTLPIIVIQVVAYPLGRFLAWALPIREYTMPKWLGGFTFSLNPCPFNVKEHTIIVMMANVSITAPYGINTIVVSDVWYHRPLGFGFSILYIIATQLTGFSLAGITRRFVVWPASMIWPGVLVSTTNLNTLHAEADPGSGSMSRLRFFILAMTGAFAYYFLPGFLFSALSYFSYIAWAAPKSNVVNQLFGVSTGLGMGILTFDWSQIAWIGSPLANPWWSEVNIGIGFVLFYWIVVPIIYYTNTWYTQYLPISSLQAADRFGNVYNVTRLLTPDFRLNTTAYAEYSPVYLTASFTVTYMLAFALTTALLVHTAVVHGRRIMRTVRNIQVEPEDIHMKLMKVYPEVPQWWYIAALSVTVVLGVVTVEVFGTGLPVWGYFVSIAMAFLYVLPSAIMFALTNMEPAVNLIAELIPGYAFQGHPLAGMIFKTFAVQSLSEAMAFCRDMKIGHYMKVPPRSMFIAQVSAAAICSFAQVALKEWMFRTIPDMCSYRQRSLLVCAKARTVYSASIIWGLVGPERLFSKGGIYNPQLWMMLVGAVLPVPLWLWARKHPHSILRNINVPLILCVCIFTPPASGINFASFLVVGFTFQYWIRRYRFAWWSKYNYVLSAALDVGTLLSAIFIFLTLGLPRAQINWWGNLVYTKTKDWLGTAVTPVPEGGFGPDTWKV